MILSKIAAAACPFFFLLLMQLSVLHCATAQTLRSEVVVRGLSEPVAAAALPLEGGVSRLLLAEKAGTVKIINLENSSATLVAKIGEDVPGEQVRLLDIVVHPEFEKNRKAYLSYVLDIEGASCFFNVVMLGVPEALVEGVPKLREELIREDMPCGEAAGGGLSFGTGGELFIGVGIGKEALGQKTAQNPASIFGKILRVRVPTAANPMESAYLAPEDNPFAASPKGSELVWALGVRDPRSLSYDAKSGKVYVVDRGTIFKDEINVATAKANFGWPMFEGTECQMMRFDCLGKSFQRPRYTASPKSGARLSGGMVYHASRAILKNRLLYANGSGATLFAATLAGKKPQRKKVGISGPVDSIAAGVKSEVYLLDTKAGLIRELK